MGSPSHQFSCKCEEFLMQTSMHGLHCTVDRRLMAICWVLYTMCIYQLKMAMSSISLAQPQNECPNSLIVEFTFATIECNPLLEYFNLVCTM